MFCWSLFHAKDQIISDVISLRLPCPTRGRRPLNYIDCIARDIGHETADMQTLMSDRDTWRGIVYFISDTLVVLVVLCYVLIPDKSK